MIRENFGQHAIESSVGESHASRLSKHGLIFFLILTLTNFWIANYFVLAYFLHKRLDLSKQLLIFSFVCHPGPLLEAWIKHNAAWMNNDMPSEMWITIRDLTWSTSYWTIKLSFRRCSNYIFALDLTSGFNGLGKDKWKTRHGLY